MKRLPVLVRNLAILAAAGALLSACIPSVHPFFNETDLVADPRLPGEWKDGDGALWAFTPDGDAGYTLVITELEDDGKKTGTFEAHLFQLGAERFLDLVASDVGFAPDQIDLVKMSVIPGHLVARIFQFEPELKLAFADFDWLKKHLEASPAALAHHRHGDSIVLTAPTAELQQFLLAHLVEGELFAKAEEAGVLARVGPQTGL